MRLRPFLVKFKSNKLPLISHKLQYSSHVSTHPSPTLTRVQSSPDDDNKYTHLQQACLRQCKQIQTHNLFDEMPQRRFSFLKLSRVIHSQSLKNGFCSKGLLANAIVDLYAKCGNLDYAEKAFNELEKRDVLAWNSMLSMYAKRGLLERVVKIFRELNGSGLSVNEHTFAIVLSACAKLGDGECGRQVHCNAIKAGMDYVSFCVGALIDMYAKCNCIGDARRVFDGAVDLDMVSWTSMIGGYVQAGLPEEALKVFEEMRRVGRVPDQVAFVTAINVLVGLQRLDDACELFSKMIEPNVVAWNVMISGHAKKGYEAEAIKFFQKMSKAGVKSTRSTLGSVLSAIASLALIDFGLLVHAEAIKQGLEANVYVGSSLINMYAKCGKMKAAEKIFNALDERNLVLWNAMLAGYSQNGIAIEVLKLFHNMKASGFHPDDYSYTSILSACAGLEYLKLGRQLHTVIIKDKLASNLFVGNALVDMYAKSGAIGVARKQFDLMRNHDSVSWNAIIVGYVQEGDEIEAFSMFQRMNLYGYAADEVSLSSILNACANIQGLEQGKQVHCLSIKSGLETSLYAGSALIDMYVKCEATGDAHLVLSSMPEKSVASVNALISGYAPNSLEEAVILFKQMQAEGLSPSEITFVNLLDACDGAQKLNLGRQIHCLVVICGLLYEDDFLSVSLLGMYMNSKQKEDASLLFSEFPCPRSVVLWTTMISGCTENDCSEEALHLYRQMRSFDILPDQATFVSVLRACAVLSSIRDGGVIHSLIFHTGFNLDELTGSALVDMYAKCGDVTGSLQAFEELGSKRDVISWNSMIVGSAKNGYAEEALKFFAEMKRKHIIPDAVTFLGVLTACSHAGKVSEGRQIFDMMSDHYGIQPRADHCACMVDLLGRWGFLREAEELIKSLEHEPDAKIWATFLSACRIHGDDIRGRWAAEKLIQLEPENSSHYVLLSNIYAASGNWDEVNSLRRMMREKGVKKFPGCSWIEVGQKTNLFVAGDEFHPRAQEIYGALMDLTAVMVRDNSCDGQMDSTLQEEDDKVNFSNLPQKETYIAI